MVTTVLVGMALAQGNLGDILVGQAHSFRASQRETHWLNGTWKLIWDDHIDGELASEEKECYVRFEFNKGSLSGDMWRLPGGQNRFATVEGKFDQEPQLQNGLLSFRQIEGDYVCSYQMSFTQGGAVGEWRDTLGRSGDFKILKFQ